MNALRFEKLSEGHDPIHNFWVLAPPRGAVSTWISPVTKGIIGYSLCAGAVIHSSTPRRDWERAWDHRATCEFLEVPCWFEPQSMLYLQGVQDAYDAGDYETIYQWLESYLEELVDP